MTSHPITGRAWRRSTTRSIMSAAGRRDAHRRVRRLRVPVLAARVPGDRARRGAARRRRALRVPALPADRDPSARARRGAAAEAAALQDRFWDMHALLFHRQQALEDDDLRGYAARARARRRALRRRPGERRRARAHPAGRRERARVRRGARHPDPVHRRRRAPRSYDAATLLEELVDDERDMHAPRQHQADRRCRTGSRAARTAWPAAARWVHLRMCQTLRQDRLLRQLAEPPRVRVTPPRRGHAIARSAEPGEDWSWCYVDEVAFVVQAAS